MAFITVYIRNHSLTGYKYGCRCVICTEENRKAQRRQRASRKARLEEDPTLAEHGKLSTYGNWCCRCDLCCEVYREWLASTTKKDAE